MNNNKKYTKPEIEIVDLEQNDIIVTSAGEWDDSWDAELRAWENQG